MALEKQPAGPNTLEIVDRLKKTVELHRGGKTWAAFQHQEIEKMERTIPGYGRYLEKYLRDASEEDRDRLFEFAYIAYELPEMRLRAGRSPQQGGEEKWWAGTDLKSQASVLEDEFGILPYDNPKLIEEVAERISSHVPELGDYVRDYVQDMGLSRQASVDAAILAFVVSEIIRSRYDPGYGTDPAQVIL